jgi:hypothetical protein
VTIAKNVTVTPIMMRVTVTSLSPLLKDTLASAARANFRPVETSPDLCASHLVGWADYTRFFQISLAWGWF